MCCSDGSFTTSLEAKLETFAQFSEALYFSSNPTQGEIRGILYSLNIPLLSVEHRGLLNSSITEAEV